MEFDRHRTYIATRYNGASRLPKRVQSPRRFICTDRETARRKESAYAHP